MEIPQDLKQEIEKIIIGEHSEIIEKSQQISKQLHMQYQECQQHMLLYILHLVIL